jgi:beta-lactamase regulating signal transducer with metallopeptidase domain
MTPALTGLALWAADYYAQATVLLLVAGAVLVCERQPSRRMMLAWVTVGSLLVLAGLVAWPAWPQIGLGFWETPNTIAVAEVGPCWTTWLGTAYAIGAATILGWLFLGALRAAWLLHRSREASSFVYSLLKQLVGRRAPRLRTSDLLDQPVALGVCQPTIVLPGAIEERVGTDQVSSLLRHEWAHIRHGDLWLLALTRLLLIVLFAHPLYWWLRARIRDDQELLADAAAAGDGPLDYARTLLSWSRGTRRQAAPAGALTFGSQSTRLKRRIAALLDPTFGPPASCPGAWCMSTAALALCLVLVLSVVTLRQFPRQPVAAPAPLAVVEPAVSTPSPVAPTPVFVAVVPVAEPSSPPEAEIRLNTGLSLPSISFGPPHESRPTLSTDGPAPHPSWALIWFVWEVSIQQHKIHRDR